MKSLKISLVLFFTLILLIFLNALYIHSCADRLSEAAEKISVGGSPQQLESFWEKNKEYIGLSISETQLDHISRLVVSIRCDHEHEDEAELKKDLALLTEAAEGLRQYEKLSVKNIF